MGSLVQIRNVSDETRRALKARAAAQGRSLNSYLVDLLDREVERPTVAEVLARAAARTGQSTTSAVEVLRQAREDRTAGPARGVG